jgi:hypothetical protein
MKESGSFDEADYEYDNEKGVPVKRNIDRESDASIRRNRYIDD